MLYYTDIQYSTLKISDKCLVTETFTSTVPRHGPLINGEISTIPKALYNVMVEIKAKEKGEGTSEYANVTVNGKYFGRCSPSGDGTCNWFMCDTLDQDVVIASGNTMVVIIQFGTGVDASEECGHQVEARITFRVIGRTLI